MMPNSMAIPGFASDEQSVLILLPSLSPLEINLTHNFEKFNVGKSHRKCVDYSFH